MNHCPILYAAKKTPKKMALLFNDHALSYKELNQAIHSITELPSVYVVKDPLQGILYLFASLRRKKLIALLSPKNPITTTQQLIKTTKKWNSFGAPQHGTILATSGSSGRIKLIQHSFENHLHSAHAVTQFLSLKPSDYFYLSLPLYHVSGIAVCFRTFSLGATLLLKSHETLATYLSAVPTQIILWQKQGLLFPKIHTRLLGGGPIFTPLDETDYASYGMTEFASSIAIGKKELQVLPHAQIKIDKNKRIWVKGESLCITSFSEEDGFTTHNPAEWLATNDQGVWSSGKVNTLTILGRLDGQFVSGGETIAPQEIQAALNTHPLVLQSSVTLLHDKLYGTRPVAEIIVKRPVSIAEMKKHLLNNLPKFKLPDHIFIKESCN